MLDVLKRLDVSRTLPDETTGGAPSRALGRSSANQRAPGRCNYSGSHCAYSAYNLAQVPLNPNNHSSSPTDYIHDPNDGTDGLIEGGHCKRGTYLNV